MTNYSETKFRSLSEARKAQVMLMSLRRIESLWQDAEKRKNLLAQMIQYYSWLEGSFLKSDLVKVLRLKPILSETMSLRETLNIAVPLERYLNISLRDHDLLQVTTKDRVENMRSSGERPTQQPLYVILDHIRSAFNVGSIFRSCECLGVSHVYCVGYTPLPIDSQVKKTAMGAEDFVNWSQFDHLEDVFIELKRKNIPLAALETSKKSQSLYEFKATKPLAVLFGNERFGIEPSYLKKVDHLLEIPMAGVKNSLNVANAFGIVAFEVLRQWGQP